MRAVGVRGGPWSGAVNGWGDVFVNGRERLKWFVAADDRWYRPSRETTVRQREISDVPVIETRIKVPGGDAVQRVYGVVNFGGAIVVEIYNDSPLPLAVAFDRPDIATMREPSPAGAQGIDLPLGSVVFPVGHHATLRVAILIDGGERASRAITAQQLESLPSFGQVERGWLAALHIAGRIDLPEASWARILTTQRCKMLLVSADSLIAGGESEDDVDLVLGHAEQVKLGETTAGRAEDVATAIERIIRKCAKSRVVQWFEQRAILSAGMVLHRAGETRAKNDLGLSWLRLASGCDVVSNHVGAVEDLENCSGVRKIAWIESQLVAPGDDGVIEICPRGIDIGWVGANFECHRLLASPEHLISFALRWHGDKPALLWEVEGPVGARVAASAIDRNFSSTEMRGETLLSSFTTDQATLVK